MITKQYIPEIEKKIFLKIDFATRFLGAIKKYKNAGRRIPTFKKAEILNVFKQLGYPSKYNGEGCYEITKQYKDYRFLFQPIITQNTPLFYFYIYKEEKLLDWSPSLIGMALYHIPYDPEMINNNFELKSIEELKEFLQSILEIFEDFVAEHIREIEAGNTPENESC